MKTRIVIILLVALTVLTFERMMSVAPVTASEPASKAVVVPTTPVVLLTASAGLFRAERSTRPVSRSLACRNSLVSVLYEAGFRGENLQEAWAIAMRESHGQPSNHANGEDFGLFQFNYPSWGGTLDWNRILDADYNARQAYRLSDGGRNWLNWGLDGKGNPAPALYTQYGWSDWQVQEWIVVPYEYWYKRYPC